MIGITNEMLATALSLQGAGGAGGAGGESEEQQITRICAGILEQLPAEFDTEAAARKHPLSYLDSMNTVLQQELLRYNKLTMQIRSSLKRAVQAIKGEVPLTPELE